MTTQTTTIKFTRTLLSMSDLVLSGSASDVYQFGEFTTDGVQWSRVTATSPWVHGRRLRAATLNPRNLTGEISVMSDREANPTVHDAALGELIACLSQFAYTTTITTVTAADTLIRSWACEPADIEIVDSMMVSDRWRWTTLTVDIPIHPVAISGAW